MTDQRAREAATNCGQLAALAEALGEAAQTLGWAARKMKGNCSGSDVSAVMLAAERATEARAALNTQPASSAKLAILRAVPDWQPIEAAPRDGFFMVWSPDHPDCPMVVRGSLLHGALDRERQGRQPKHLSFGHFTHWRPLPAPPASIAASSPAIG